MNPNLAPISATATPTVPAAQHIRIEEALDNSQAPETRRVYACL